MLSSRRARRATRACVRCQVALRLASLLCELHASLAPTQRHAWSAAPLAPALASVACDGSRSRSQALALQALATLARASPELVASLLVQHVLPLLDAEAQQRPSASASAAVATLVLSLLGSPGSASEQLGRYLELAHARLGKGEDGQPSEEPAWLSRLLPLMV